MIEALLQDAHDDYRPATIVCIIEDKRDIPDAVQGCFVPDPDCLCFSLFRNTYLLVDKYDEKELHIQIDRKCNGWCFACLCRDARHTAVYASHALLPYHLLDQLLVATDRHANMADLGLQAAGVKVDVIGAVIIDNRMRTLVPQIMRSVTAPISLNIFMWPQRPGQGSAQHVR